MREACLGKYFQLLFDFDKNSSELQTSFVDGLIMQEQHQSETSSTFQGWQNLLATLLKLNRTALEAKREEEVRLIKQQEEAA